MKKAVMGSGGLGSFYGGLLARAGCDATLNAGGAHLQRAVAPVQRRTSGGHVANAIRGHALMVGELCE